MLSVQIVDRCVAFDEYHENGSTNWKLTFFRRLKETQGFDKLPNISAQKQGNKQLIPHLEEGYKKSGEINVKFHILLNSTPKSLIFS